MEQETEFLFGYLVFYIEKGFSTELTVYLLSKIVNSMLNSIKIISSPLPPYSAPH